MSAEWWVMRVIGPDTMPLTPQIAEDLRRGALAAVNGEICEPVECCDDQEEALAKAAKLGRPDRVFKVVLNANLEDLASA